MMLRNKYIQVLAYFYDNGEILIKRSVNNLGFLCIVEEL
mgnify:CR=1 FL=1|jgi:hypothetical protein